MAKMDSPFDPGADSCLSRSAKLLGIFSLMVALLVRGVRKARRR